MKLCWDDDDGIRVPGTLGLDWEAGGESHGFTLPGIWLWEWPGEVLVGIWDFWGEFAGAKHQMLCWEEDEVCIPGNSGVFLGFAGAKQ